jgi:hypothetical protein
MLVLRLACAQPDLVAGRMCTVARPPPEVTPSDLRGDLVTGHPAAAVPAQHLDYRFMQRHVENVPRLVQTPPRLTKTSLSLTEKELPMN